MNRNELMNGKRTWRRIGFFVSTLLCVYSINLLTTQARAADLIKIGLLSEPKTLNVMRASDRWSRKVLSQMYQTLLTRDPDTLELTPWLAAEYPTFNESELSYTVKLRPAKWSDGSELTSEDVAFTVNLIKEFKVPRYFSKWKFVNKIETLDKRTVKFYLDKPKAIFITRTLGTPIVSKKEWSKIAEEVRGTEKPLKALLNYKVEKPIGSGPFVLKEWREGTYIYLERNEHFFGKDQEINGRALGPYIDGSIFKFYGTSDAAILALKKGAIDMFWWGIQPGYLDDLKGESEIQLFYNERSALYYMGFNVRKAPFDDPALRRAIATLIDKDFVITRILQENGVKMTSIVPPGNAFWHCPELPTYGDGLSKEERAKDAYRILKEAGYTWETAPVDDAGKVVQGKGIRLPNGEPMEPFTILTPPTDYDPLRAMSGTIIQEWLKAVGMPASAKPMAFGALLDQVKVKHDFDAFILGYGALSLDPDYLRSFFHSRNDKSRGWNMSGYKNPAYDRIADESANLVDRDERRKLIWEMQQILLRDVPYIPLYNPKLIEGVRTGKFEGWVETLEGIGNLWSFCSIKPI
jgi:ABC-type transport system substrate-binding protein